MRLTYLCFGFFLWFSTLAAWGDTTPDAFNSGVTLYQQGQYAQAIASLKQAVQLDPQNWQAFQVLAFSYYQTGDHDDAFAAAQSSLAIHPDNTDLKKWAAEVGYHPPPTSLSGIVPPKINDVTFFKPFDLRITFSFSTLSLEDFKNNNSYLLNLATITKAGGNTGVVYYRDLPGFMLPEINLEASARISPDLEGGLFLSYLPVGTVNNNLQILAAYYPGGGFGVPITIILQDSNRVTALEAGLQGRFTFAHGNFRPFISGGGMAVPIWIDYGVNDVYLDGSSENVETDKLNETFTALGFGAQVEAGFDWDLGGGFALSPSAGYQFISASNFQANAPDGGRSGLIVTQTGYGAAIEPVESGNLQRFVYATTTGNGPIYPGAPPPNSTPMVLDLSGLKASLQFSYTF